MQQTFATYTSAAAVTPSDTTLINCRAIYIGGAGNLAINTSASGGTTVTLTAPPVGSLLPIELNQGRIMAATTATLIVALQ